MTNRIEIGLPEESPTPAQALRYRAAISHNQAIDCDNSADEHLKRYELALGDAARHRARRDEFNRAADILTKGPAYDDYLRASINRLPG